jgi:hypothetical protein
MFGLVRLQAAVMSCADVLLLLTVLFAGLAAATLIMRGGAKIAGMAGGHPRAGNDSLSLTGV